MQFDINSFRATLKSDGARPSQFNVILAAPPFVALNTPQLSFMAEASSIPAMQVGMIAQPYFGRVTKHAGDAVVSNWNIQVVNDESFDLRGAFERWMNALSHMSTRLQAQRVLGATASSNSYVGQAVVNQFGKEGKIIRAYKLTNVWPVDVSQIDLNWSSVDQFEKFSVTFCMDWFEVIPPSLTPDVN